MGVMDKLINAMKVSDEDDNYNDEDEYMEDDADQADDYSDDTEEDDVSPEEEEPVSRTARSSEESYSRAEESQSASAPRRRRSYHSSNGMEVCVIRPTSVNDASAVTDTLLANSTVVLNLEGLDVEVAQRIIDFTAGSCYAVKGNVMKISHYIFVITPQNVDISGDITAGLGAEENGSTFNMSGYSN